MKAKLITKAILKKLPPLYATDGLPDEERKVPLKLFNPVGRGRWYIFEYDPEEEVGFGYVTGFGEDELGYVSLEEMRNLRLPFGLTIERDRHWDPETTLAQVKSGRAV